MQGSYEDNENCCPHYCHRGQDVYRFSRLSIPPFAYIGGSCRRFMTLARANKVPLDAGCVLT
jgi:hypothetical protein